MYPILQLQLRDTDCGWVVSIVCHLLCDVNRLNMGEKNCIAYVGAVEWQYMNLRMDEVILYTPLHSNKTFVQLRK